MPGAIRGSRPPMFDLHDAAVVEMDTDFRVLSWGPGAERIFGWSAGDAVGCLGPEVAPPVDPAAREQRAAATRRHGFWGVVEMLNRHGDVLTIEAVVVLRHGPGRVRFVSVMRETGPTFPRKMLGKTNPRSRISGFPDRPDGGCVSPMINKTAVAIPVGQRIRFMREQAGISGRSLARRAEVDERMLRGWEAGDHVPTVPSLLRLIPHIGGTVDYYYGTADEPAT